MYKKTYLILIIFFLSFLAKLEAKTWWVGKNESLHSLNQAIQSARAGDEIRVKKGVYFERNLIIDKPLTLIGEGLPVLDGEGKYEIISIKASSVKVIGFHIRNSGISSLKDLAGIKIYDAQDVQIVHNLITNSFFGIYTQYGKNCQIKDNQIVAYGKEEQQSGNGIHCWNSSYMHIEDNVVSGHRDGIYFEFVTQSIIKNNRSFRNLRYGLHFMFSNHDTYISNVFTNNGAGVAVMFSNHVNMFNNTFHQNWGDASYGILLKEISDGKIQGNQFKKNTTGIYLEGVSRVNMSRNTFSSNGWGLKIQASCQDMNIHQNNFINNTFDVSTNGSLVLNNFDGNYWDKYEGYDLNKDHFGDIPFRPVSLFSIILEKNPTTLIMFRSFISALMDKTEKLIPSLTPEQLKDQSPRVQPIPL
ncbi:nitrous oxide reductase family maturation protein NosD [Aquirufa rosea]|uniref:Nitrous oxide reductase family maturation protein NosD n=1 Tax=Aquirufa rosea TaxID=2509241 RepID=A0A4Q1C313_9BACT|nr:nitrous oxide reductase family maturation protein NosD [Aquirufa rosea]RXK52596.1 nitrous oxide reductase family maturation protein NosD [Aquirufa rosea]